MPIENLPGSIAGETVLGILVAIVSVLLAVVRWKDTLRVLGGLIVAISFTLIGAGAAIALLGLVVSILAGIALVLAGILISLFIGGFLILIGFVVFPPVPDGIKATIQRVKKEITSQH